MYSHVIVIAFAWLAGGLPQNPVLESQAVARIQQAAASQFDVELPARSFGVWLQQIAGPQAGISWQLTDCGESPAAGTAPEVDRPLCVEATAALADDRKMVVMIVVGTVRQGVIGKPKLYLAVVEQYGNLINVDRLRDMPAVLRIPKPRMGRRRPALPKTDARRDPLLLFLPPPGATAALSSKPPAIGRAEDPPLSPREPRRVSEGVLQGNVINKVMPIYPLTARQLNLSGEVVVEITISEDGRVIAAAAMSGPFRLREPAETAARKWIFKPTMLNGLPVQTRGALTFVFTRQ